MEWSEQNISLLTEMWRNGFTARQIAQKIGQGVTRNAIIGKAHRMGLSQRPAPVMKRERLAPISLGIMRNCQWPIGDTSAKDFHYCGHPVKQGKPYCEAHCDIAYRNVFAEEKELRLERNAKKLLLQKESNKIDDPVY